MKYWLISPRGSDEEHLIILIAALTFALMSPLLLTGAGEYELRDAFQILSNKV